LQSWLLDRRRSCRPGALRERSVQFVASSCVASVGPVRQSCRPTWAGRNHGLTSASIDRRDGQYVLHTRLLQQNWPQAEANGCPLVRQLSDAKLTHFAQSEFFAF
jgi:hypothetical protein